MTLPTRRGADADPRLQFAAVTGVPNRDEGDGPVWVCVPTYNEAENIAAMVTRILGTFEDAGIDGHVLIVDDDSPDGTGRIADDLAANDIRVAVLHRAVRQGLGPAYCDGFRMALAHGAQRIIEMDCDFSHDPAAIPSLLAAADRADLVLGSRYVPGGAIENWSLLRRIVSRGGCAYARAALAVAPHDLTGGFKCFRRDVLEAIPLEEVSAAGYVFQIEMTYRAILLGYRVVEVPITFRDRMVGTSKMSRRIVAEAALHVPRLRWSLRKASGS